MPTSYGHQKPGIPACENISQNSGCAGSGEDSRWQGLWELTARAFQVENYDGSKIEEVKLMHISIEVRCLSRFNPYFKMRWERMNPGNELFTKHIGQRGGFVGLK